MVPSRTCISGPVGPPGRYSSCPCPRFLPWITHFTLQFTDMLNCFTCFLVAGVATGSLKTQDCLLRSNIQYIYQNLSNLVRCLLQLSGTRRPPQNDSHLSVPSQVLPFPEGHRLLIVRRFQFSLSVSALLRLIQQYDSSQVLAASFRIFVLCAGATSTLDAEAGKCHRYATRVSLACASLKIDTVLRPRGPADRQRTSLRSVLNKSWNQLTRLYYSDTKCISLLPHADIGCQSDCFPREGSILNGVTDRRCSAAATVTPQIS